jgi:glycosyltransferase involved in cell wall biosynthesis
MNRNSVSGVVASVDFASYLAVTLPHNAWLFDEAIVVTADDDTDTISVAEKCGARIITTDRFWIGGAGFNRGAGLNVGIDAARADNIYCFDADVLLPGDLKDALRQIDAETLYGLSRYTENIDTKGSWRLRGTADDYAAGYSQIFCRNASYFPGGFSEEFPSAGHSDIEFMLHWPSALRKKLSQTPCVHIGQRKAFWAGVRNLSFRIEDSIPTFRVQDYPRTKTLLVQRLDRCASVANVTIKTGSNSCDMGRFRPEDYGIIPWDCQEPSVELRVAIDDIELVQWHRVNRR